MAAVLLQGATVVPVSRELGEAAVFIDHERRGIRYPDSALLILEHAVDPANMLANYPRHAIVRYGIEEIVGAHEDLARPGFKKDPSVAIGDRKSTRLNSSHLGISYAVFCLKKKNQTCFRVNTTDKHARSPIFSSMLGAAGAG